MRNIQITSLGILKALKHHTCVSSIAEYIWNGFDAKATEVNILMQSGDYGRISKLKIIDNGCGIADSSRFTLFYESNKQLTLGTSKNLSAIHGTNGIGRLTFFTFSSSAQWDTVYEKEGKKYKYSITINANKLDNYDISEEKETDEQTGTVVSFYDIHTITPDDFDSDIKSYLCREFSWFLELNSMRKFSIKINNSDLNYQENFISDSIDLEHKIGEYSFNLKFIRWLQSLNKEYSRYYFINSKGEGIYSNTTTLNNKGDNFSHSVFVKSGFFNQEHFFPYETSLLKSTPQGQIYHSLIHFINQQLQNRRRLFLKTKSDQIIEEFKRNNAFPKFGNNTWDQHRKNELEDFLKELYQVEPKIFSSLNIEQKKVFVHFLNLILDSDERNKLIDVLGEIIKLDSSELEHLSESLKITKLANIIKTVRLIEDRYRAINQLENLVFKPELEANERDHIQKFVENHYWIFGEQYHLVTAAEPKFEEALRRYIYLLRGEKPVVSIDHPDKNKEMDIFMVRQLVNNSSINNVVVELKHPKIKLGSKELEQVKQYMGVILEQDEFNASNMTWEFYLIGNDFHHSKYIEREIQNAKSHGEKSLVYFVDNYKIYVKKWSEIFTEFHLKHKFLNDKLELEKIRLNTDVTSANEVISHIHSNSAVQAPQRVIPEN
jgi:hypothetical protein